ncbi:MAG: cytochrome c biogenesis protein ResB [Erysipelotrichaceae bacterium]|nr:cytochrome c biogenesis protein ResB [Erysipelotrichaceae bacterium]
MKKILQFIQSMTFGLILLGAITACSVIGSLIVQNGEPMTYVRYYPDHYQIIFALQFDHIFTSWYFISLSALLCINLTLCSVIRISRISRQKPAAYEAAFAPVPEGNASPEQLERIRQKLESMRCRKEERNCITVYSRNDHGWYGSFLTHLGLLLTIILFGAAMYLPKVIDEPCYPGDSLILDDGTKITVDSFRIEDETGKLDYTSRINVILPDGRESGMKEVSVNHPVSMGRYKVYQQTYGTVGKIRAERNGKTDEFYLENKDFMSADGKNGIWFDELYPGFITDDQGRTTLIQSTSGHYENPVYVFTLMLDGSADMMMAFPGDTIEVKDLVFTFLDPVEYPGLRIKRTPVMINPLLLGAVLLMTLGLYLAMFAQPVIVAVGENGYAVRGPKPENTQYEINMILKQDQKGTKV